MKVIRKQLRKSILQNKIQVISVIILTILIAICFNYLIGGMIVVDETYHKQLDDANLEDFRMLPKIELDDYIDDIVQDYDVDAQDMKILSEKELIDKYDISIFEYGSEVMNSLSQEYNFTYQQYEETTFKEDNLTYFITPYDEDISNFTMVDGHFPDDEQISITFQYAKQKNISIDDEIDILDEPYTVSGFHIGPLHNFLYSSEHSESVELTSNMGVIMNSKDFKQQDVDKSSVYLATFNDTVDNKDKILKDIENDSDVSQITLPEDTPSINNIENDINTNTYLGIVAVTILAITIFVIQIILIRNQLFELNPDLGIMLAIGVKKSSIIQSFYFYIVLILASTIIGSLLGIQLQELTFSQMEVTYNINEMVPYNVSYPMLFGLVFIILFALLILLFVGLKLNQKPLNMINKISTKKSNHSILTVFKKIIKLKSFSKRIKTSFTFKNLGFLFTLMFSIIIVLNLFLIGLNLLMSNQENYQKFADSIHYDSIETLSTDLTSNKDNFQIGYSDSYKIAFNDDETTTITILGIKRDNTFYQDINVEKDTLIINKKLAYDNNITSSDSVTIDFNGNLFTFNDVKVNTNPLDSNNYMYIDQLWENDDEVEDGQYNLTYNNPSGSDVLYSSTKDDEVELVNESLLQMNTLIIVLFIATTFISIILIILIANLTVNENVQAINALNMLGYSYPKIFFLSTDVFKLPIIFAAILGTGISPLLTNVLEEIINHNNSSIYIDINSSLVSIVISTIVILIIYYIIFVLNFIIYVQKRKS